MLPVDRFSLWQWIGLGLSFAGMLVAFGLPTPAVDPRQSIGDVMLVGAAVFWAASTLITKVTALVHARRAEKLMLYQLVVSAPMMALAALVSGEHFTHAPSALAIGALAYQTFWVVSVTFVVWFALVVRYSASRLSAFTFLTPLVRRRRRPSGAGRAADPGFCRRRGAGRGRADPGESDALTAYCKSGTPVPSGHQNEHANTS